MKTYAIVVGVIYERNKLLILRRQSERKYYANKWEFVCGYNKDYETLEESVIREVREETACVPKTIKRGSIVEVVEPNVTWIVFPFLVTLQNSDVKIDSEHSDFKWINISEIDDFDCVPGFRDDLKSLGVL